MTKFYAQEKRVFDINKVTVVGSPTITSDGVASGFDGSNYLKTIPLTDLKGKSWTIRTKWINQGITTPNNSNTFFNFGSWIAWGSVFYAYNTRILRFYIKTGTSEEPSTEALGKSITLPYDPSYIYASLSFDIDTGVYTCKADYGEGEVLVGTYTATTTNKELYLINIATTHTINIGPGSDNTYNKNATDLTQFSITVDNELVHSPTKPVYSLERRKEGFDLSKFTVVGSPTITEAGVASGFSGTNAIRTPEILWGNSLKASIRFNLSSLPHYACLIGGTATKENSIRLTVNPNGELRLSVSDDGSMNYTVVKNLTCPAGTISLNNWYDVDVLFDGFSYKIYVNGSLLAEKTVDKLPYNSSLQLGSERSDANYGQVQGLIDLKQFSITVDGKEVFTGAKEKFYAMRGM